VTNYQKASFLGAIIVLVIFIVLSLIKQNINYLWPGLLPVFILFMSGFSNRSRDK